jgi:hypothetical protein
MEQSAAEAMKEKISSRKSQMTPSSPKIKRNARYWDEGRVLKVGFLLVFVRAFARIILKTFGLFTPVVFFMFCMVFGGVTLSVLEGTSENFENNGNIVSFENSARQKTEKIAPVKK